MTNDHQHHQESSTDPAAGLRTSGRAGLFIVAAGMGLLTIIGLVNRLAGGRQQQQQPPGNPDRTR